MKKSVGGNRAARSGKKPSFRAFANVMGKGKEAEERVGGRAGEDLDAALHLDDLAHGRVGWRDDPAFGVAVGGFPAGELGHDDVLDAGGVDREGEPPGDVLDQVLV